MLRRLTFGLFCLACVAFAAACGSSGSGTLSSGGVPGLGPNYATNSIYAVNTTQNAIVIFSPSPSSAATPRSQIGGTSTGLNGPQYDAFDVNKHLYVTNYNAATGLASVQVYATYATGNVIPLQTISGNFSELTQPRGIAITPNGNAVVANFNPALATIASELLIFPAGGSGNFSPVLVAGPSTQLNVPTGVATDKNNAIYVANRGGASVTVYPFPTAPTSSPSATPTANPSATPAPNNLDVPPTKVIAGSATGLIAPTGIALDASGNMYVVDPDNGTPSVFVFAAGANGNAAPMRRIVGPQTGLSVPTDVKVDAAGNVYVADSGAGKILVYAPGANGNAAPTAAVPVSGTLVGLALSP